MHQAYVKPEGHGDLEYCLALDKQINKRVKACSELVPVDLTKEPDLFIDELNALIKNPTATEKRRLKKIITKVEQLRSWGKQANKPRMIKQRK